MSKFNSFAGILDFFIPADVLSSVLLVFTMENVLNYTFTAYVPQRFQAVSWFLVYVIGVVTISVLNYVTADEDEREDLNEDIDNL